LVALLGVGAIDLGVVCLRWGAWQRVAGFDEFGGNVPLWLVALLIAVFVAVMALGIVWLERKRSAAPAQRPAEDASSSTSGASRAGIYGWLAGTIFGSTGWLFMMSLTARDWVAVVVAVYAVVVFTLSARSCIAHRRRMWPVLLIDVAALYALYLVVLNLRWSHWMAKSGHPSPYARISLTYVNVAVTLIVAALALLIGLRWAADRQRHTTEK
jgi:hypothetical protein